MISQLEFYLRLTKRLTNLRIKPIRPMNLNTAKIARNGLAIQFTPSYRIYRLRLPISLLPSS